jgi:hypothetical protein
MDKGAHGEDPGEESEVVSSALEFGWYDEIRKSNNIHVPQSQ